MAAKTSLLRSIRPIPRADLVSEVVQRMRNEIIAGTFGSDELPSEGELEVMFGVSRTVIREAMRVLWGMELVEVSRGRRPRIKPLDPTTIVKSLGTFMQRGEHPLLHLMEVRKAVETEVARLAAERITREQLDAMERNMETMSRCRSLREKIEADIRFHELLAEATGNEVFLLLMKAVSSLLRESLNKTISRTGVEASLEGHKRIFAAVRSRNPDAARKTMSDHLDAAARDIQESEG